MVSVKKYSSASSVLGSQGCGLAEHINGVWLQWVGNGVECRLGESGKSRIICPAKWEKEITSGHRGRARERWSKLHVLQVLKDQESLLFVFIYVNMQNNSWHM